MTEPIAAGARGAHLVLDSAMTLTHASEIESRLLDAMRRHPKVEVDLSRVNEIDVCGLHLLGFLDHFTDKGLVIVATSPAVDQAYASLRRRCRGAGTPAGRWPAPGARPLRAGPP